MSELTHLDESGAARMVDVGAKPATARSATAAGTIRMARDALNAVRDGSGAKGDVLAAARIAGIMGAKKTAELIPLCHPLGLDSVTVECAFLADGIAVTATAALVGPEQGNGFGLRRVELREDAVQRVIDRKHAVTPPRR